MRPYLGFACAIWLVVCAGEFNLSAQHTAANSSPQTLDAVKKQLLDRREQLARSAGDMRRPTQPGSLPEASLTPRDMSLALAALQVEKGVDSVKGQLTSLSRARLFLKLSHLVREKKMTGLPVAPRLTERAYFARNDGSPQPWFFFKPEKHDGSTRLPLVVFLHGYVPTTSRTEPFLVADFVLDLAEEYGCYFAIPHGRTNTDFQYAGEVDVLRVIEEAKASFPVDDNQIYLLGISMGGAGVWHVATHYPTPFAGVAPINAQGDWFRFWHEMFDYPAREDLPAHIRYVLAMNNPLDLAGNLSNLYSYSQHASRCFVGVGHTKAMVKALENAGAPHEFFEDPDQLGHYIYWRPECWRRAFEKLLGNPVKLKVSNPRKVQFETYSLRFSTAYWVQINRITRWGRPAKVSAEWPPDGPVTVTTQNISSLTLTVPPQFAEGATTIPVVWNGKRSDQPVRRVNGHRQLSCVIAETAKKAPISPKTSRVCGPVADVFNFPFVIVQGTDGSPTAIEKNDRLAQKIAEDWYTYAEGRARVIRDLDVTPDIMKHHGLVLVGFPDENSVYATFADKFPVTVNDENILLPDGAAFSRQEHGLIMTQPNPLYPERYVLIYAGRHWGAGRSSNHKFDCLPDFSVFTDTIVKPVGYNAFKAAGLFDSNWTYSRELTDFSSAPRPPSTRIPQTAPAGD